MSGIRVGSRLEQLYDLRRRLNHEIAAEERKAATDTPTPAAQRPGLAATDKAVHDQLDHLGVTSAQVKEWAVEQGLLPAVVRGRVARHIVNAFVQDLKQRRHEGAA